MDIISKFVRLRQEDCCEFQVSLGYVVKLSQRREKSQGAGEIAQQLRGLAALPKDLGPTPSTHMVAHNCMKPSSR
jgi:hypothetical protein